MKDTDITLDERAMLYSVSRVKEIPIDELRNEDMMQTTLLEAILKENQSLMEENTRLKTDSMTGLLMRSQLPDAINKRKNTEYYSVIFFDIDHFKKLNDNFDHQFGDMVLEYIGKYVKKNFTREADRIRYGGEEFVIILPHTSLDAAYMLAEKLRTDIKQNLVKDLLSEERVEEQYKAKLRGDYKNGISISAGVVYGTKADDMKELIRLADQYLYHSKQNGRDMTTCQTNYKP
jgi:diguanylate cyclase (GGDEF)-like protein